MDAVERTLQSGAGIAKAVPWFEAKYPGTCSWCEERFTVGDRIRRDGEGGYECCDGTHEEVHLISGNAVRKIVEVICDKCNITKPCFCD